VQIRKNQSYGNSQDNDNGHGAKDTHTQTKKLTRKPTAMRLPSLLQSRFNTSPSLRNVIDDLDAMWNKKTKKQKKK
jgi:hypothetical protein